jgi:nucleotide-binding universal stress UspA family protein
MFSRILLASDGSEDALKAAAFVADLARKYGSQVTVLHVFNMPISPVAFVGAPGIELDAPMMDQYADDVQAAVARRTGRVLEEAGVEYDTRLEKGHPADRIVEVAEEGHYDLIVLGSRGLSEFKRFLLGSVSDRVSHHAHCPVLIVK